MTQKSLIEDDVTNNKELLKEKPDNRIDLDDIFSFDWYRKQSKEKGANRNKTVINVFAFDKKVIADMDVYNKQTFERVKEKAKDLKEKYLNNEYEKFIYSKLEDKFNITFDNYNLFEIKNVWKKLFKKFGLKIKRKGGSYYVLEKEWEDKNKTSDFFLYYGGAYYLKIKNFAKVKESGFNYYVGGSLGKGKLKGYKYEKKFIGEFKKYMEDLHDEMKEWKKEFKDNYKQILKDKIRGA